MTRALVVTDVQNDFCEGGSLAVAGGARVAQSISLHVAKTPYDVVVATRDWHRDPGAHFSAEADFVDTWPEHCVAGTHGARLHRGLDTSRIEAIFDKGEYAAAYSGFEGTEPGGSRLADWLTARGVDAVDVVGIATDHCVRATALDAVRTGFTTSVLLPLTAGVAAETTSRALEQMRDAGVRLVGEPIVASG